MNQEKKSSGVKVVRAKDELCSALEPLHGSRIGLVPTMGAFHDGHLALLRAARKESTPSSAACYQPTQFGQSEDLERYPRNEARDLELARAEGVDFLFAPSPEEIYPPGFETRVEPERLALELEGVIRPTHFRGVATICLKLFNIVRPNVAYFGAKDAQQLAVIERLVLDLDLELEIRPVETVATTTAWRSPLATFTSPRRAQGCPRAAASARARRRGRARRRRPGRDRARCSLGGARPQDPVRRRGGLRRAAPASCGSGWQDPFDRQRYVGRDEEMSTPPPGKLGLPELAVKKRRGEKIVMVTAYDSPGARFAEDAGIDILLVGDTAAMVVLGHESTTVPVTVEEMLFLTRTVARVARRPIVVGDMPSFLRGVRRGGRLERSSLRQGRRRRRGQARGRRHLGLPRHAIVAAGIPVMGHIGLTPQSATMLGGFKTQGKTAARALELVNEAIELERPAASRSCSRRCRPRCPPG